MWLLLAATTVLAAAPSTSMPATPPSPIRLTAEEAAAVDRGEIVVRYATQANGWQAIGVADVQASPGAIMDAVYDLPPRVAEVDFLNGISIYSTSTDGAVRHQGARWKAGALGFTSVFHVYYSLYWDAGWCTFTLDQGKANDIEGTDGGYHAYAVSGGSRMVYYNTAPPTGAPTWLQNRLQSGSMRDQMAGIRSRAEAAEGKQAAQ